MARNGQHPQLFREPKKHLQNLSQSIIDEVLSDAQETAMNSEEDVEVKRMPQYLQVTQSRMAKKGTIDLKPFFARSSKKKFNKQGQWYLTIPIRKKTRDMPRRSYDKLRNMPQSNKPVTVNLDYLYDRRKSSSPSVSKMNYKPKSNNITVIPEQHGEGTRNTYVAFRTVSANSPANSWIINRSNVNQDDMSKTLLENINRLMKYKLKTLGR